MESCQSASSVDKDRKVSLRRVQRSKAALGEHRSSTIVRVTEMEKSLREFWTVIPVLETNLSAETVDGYRWRRFEAHRGEYVSNRVVSRCFRKRCKTLREKNGNRSRLESIESNPRIETYSFAASNHFSCSSVYARTFSVPRGMLNPFVTTNEISDVTISLVRRYHSQTTKRPLLSERNVRRKQDTSSKNRKNCT